MFCRHDLCLRFAHWCDLKVILPPNCTHAHTHTHRSGLLEVGAGAVVGLNEALPAVEERHHEHAQGEEVAGHAAHRFVLRLGGCERREGKRETELRVNSMQRGSIPVPSRSTRLVLGCVNSPRNRY